MTRPLRRFRLNNPRNWTQERSAGVQLALCVVSSTSEEASGRLGKWDKQLKCVRVISLGFTAVWRMFGWVDVPRIWRVLYLICFSTLVEKQFKQCENKILLWDQLECRLCEYQQQWNKSHAETQTDRLLTRGHQLDQQFEFWYDHTRDFIAVWQLNTY